MYWAGVVSGLPDSPTVLLTDLVWLNGDVRSMFIMATVEGTGLCSDGIVAA